MARQVIEGGLTAGEFFERVTIARTEGTEFAARAEDGHGFKVARKVSTRPDGARWLARFFFPRGPRVSLRCTLG